MQKKKYFKVIYNNFVHSILIALFALFGVISNQTIAFADPPEVTIDFPENYFEVQFGESVLFSATATDPDDDAISSYLWSAPQGVLSTLPVFSTTELEIGTHLINLVVTDATGEKGYDYITVIVQPKDPTIKILRPSNGSSYDYNSPLVTTSEDVVVFEARATDEQDDPDDITIRWNSSIDNDFATGSLVESVTLSSGIHVIEAIATDSDGNTATASITITIRNRAPTAEITLPDDDSEFMFGELITFMGNATDPEQGRLTGESLVWTSSQGDLIGTGEVVSTKSLKSGIHYITLTATDANGAQDSASITITVGNSPPKAEITSPEDRASFKFKETIIFKGSGTDDEDGTLPPENLIWTSSIDGELGEGYSLAVDDLTSGTHTITLTVTDSQDSTAIDQIVVIVGNSPPVPVITAPANNSSHSFGYEIIFEGYASDAEEGDIDSTSLTWSSDKDGILGTGESIYTDTLSINTHIITLTAADSEGVKGSATITITVGNAAPEVLIIAPTNNSSHPRGREIEFEGKATDVEDGELSDEQLSWFSDKDGFLGYGEAITKDNLSVNTHIITFTATDNGGSKTSASITITVGNASPVALITAPA
ncbi:MAG: hypothetical protein HQK68_12690, partial [Desulfamplus sp.]|nr:hypothetical protein [Desulfamplus sp.]